MTARRSGVHKTPRVTMMAQQRKPPVKIVTVPKNLLSDERAKALTQKLHEIIGELEGVKVATQIGLPCHPRWRYHSVQDAIDELRDIDYKLHKLIEEYGE